MILLGSVTSVYFTYLKTEVIAQLKQCLHYSHEVCNGFNKTVAWITQHSKYIIISRLKTQFSLILLYSWSNILFLTRLGYLRCFCPKSYAQFGYILGNKDVHIYLMYLCFVMDFGISYAVQPKRN